MNQQPAAKKELFLGFFGSMALFWLVS